MTYIAAGQINRTLSWHIIGPTVAGPFLQPRAYLLRKYLGVGSISHETLGSGTKGVP